VRTTTAPYPRKSLGELALERPPAKEVRRLHRHGLKWCGTCKAVKLFSDYEYFAGLGRHSKLCKPCRVTNKSAIYGRWKVWRSKIRLEILNAYGGLCACCGELRLEFLSVDHIAGGGNAHRRALGCPSGLGFYLWLKRENYPNGFRILCHNCNMARGFYGYCPHEREVGMKDPF